MGFKDILVAIDAAPSAAGRIGLAAGLAERFGAHLAGLHSSISLDVPQAAGTSIISTGQSTCLIRS